MPVDKTRRRPRVSPAGSEWSTPRTRLVHRLSPGLSTGVEGLGHAAAEAPTPPPAHRYPPPRARPRPDPCHAPPVHRRPCGRRPCPPQVGHAPSRAPEVRTPPRGDNWATRLPALVREVVETGSSSSTGAHRECPHDTRSPPALAPGPCCPVEAAGGDPRRAGAARTTPHLRPIRTPAPTGALDGERHRGVIADRDRVGGGGSLPAQRGRARGRRCVRDRRSACSAAAADGTL